MRTIIRHFDENRKKYGDTTGKRYGYEYENYNYTKNQASHKIKFMISLKYVYDNSLTEKQKDFLNHCFFNYGSNQRDFSIAKNINDSTVSRRKKSIMNKCEKVLIYVDVFYKHILSDYDNINTNFVNLLDRNRRKKLSKKQKESLLFFINLIDKDEIKVFYDFFILDKKMCDLAIENGLHISTISRKLKTSVKKVLEIIKIYKFTLQRVEKGLNISEIFN